MGIYYFTYDWLEQGTMSGGDNSQGELTFGQGGREITYA
jgi:hypothetical protein